MTSAKPNRKRDWNTAIPDESDLTTLVSNWISGTPFRSERDFAYLAEVGLSKFVSKDTDPAEVRRQRAIEKWLEAERLNDLTEDRLLNIDPEYQVLPRVTLSRFLTKLQRIILDLLGDTVPCDALSGGFSGGATTSRKRALSQPCSKFAGQAHITQGATGWWHLVLTEAKLLFRRGSPGFKRPTVVSGNVMFTVPKTTSIDRVAAKEPDLNMYMQKGVGNYIRAQLRRFGIDLNDQSRNRGLARQGSTDGSLATLDLSSASDSVTVEFCRMALPPLWFACLMDLRSPITTLPDGTEHVNTMMSSMGNGFTFELESLLFYALARTTTYFEGVRGVVSIFGDDIIVPTDAAVALMDVLRLFGFRVNPDKSFWSGPFRESCGGHYDSGCDISPFYLRGPLARLTDVIKTANALRAWGGKNGTGVCDPRINVLWSLLAKRVPLHLWGGDDLSSESSLVCPVVRPKNRLVPVTEDYDPTGSYLYWHNLADRRRGVIDDPLITSEPTEALTAYKLAKVKSDGRRCDVPWLTWELEARCEPSEFQLMTGVHIPVVTRI